jgi:hypothetical protein
MCHPALAGIKGHRLKTQGENPTNLQFCHESPKTLGLIFILILVPGGKNESHQSFFL